MPTWVGACGARISQAAPWISGPKVILSQCRSKRSRSNSSRLASSVGNGKIWTAEPSGSVAVFGRVAVTRPLLSWLAAAARRVEGDPHSGEDTQPRALKANRVLVVPVEQVVDPRISGHAIAQIVGTGEVDESVAVGGQAGNRPGTVNVDPRADKQEGSREHSCFRSPCSWAAAAIPDRGCRPWR